MTTLEDVKAAAESHGLNYERVVTRDDGCYEILFSWEPHDGYMWWGGTGFLQSEEQCIDFAYDLLSSMDTEELMGLLKNDKLFPHIRGVMLKEKRVTLNLSGKVNITELKGENQGDARAELHFSNHGKTAVINRNQLLVIISIYDDEPEAWKGAPVVFYAERGKWFGKMQWGIRVDEDETIKKARAAGYILDKKKQVYVKKNGAAPQPEQPEDDEEDRPALISQLDDIGSEIYGDDWLSESEQIALNVSFGRVRAIDAMSADELREAINDLEISRQGVQS